jgi:hypothetical protein
VFNQELEEKVRSAGRAFDAATSEDIVESGKQYLARLEEYLSELYEHPAAPGHAPPQPGPSGSYEAIAATREALRGAIEQEERERDRVGALLGSFTETTFGEAVGTLNALKYKGHDTWKLSGGVVTDGVGESLSLQEAGEIALRLRREEHVAGRSRM